MKRVLPFIVLMNISAVGSADDDLTPAERQMAAELTKKSDFTVATEMAQCSGVMDGASKVMAKFGSSNTAAAGQNVANGFAVVAMFYIKKDALTRQYQVDVGKWVDDVAGVQRTNILALAEIGSPEALQGLKNKMAYCRTKVMPLERLALPAIQENLHSIK
jgi:hypothetical protein